jgi:glucose/arabinose dehydrogenase
MLYVTTGDATERAIAQELGSLGGKILRIADDGTAPRDNPFAGRAGARPEIWSWGHRHGQGIDWQPGTGTLFESEHGPSGFDGPGGGDEINAIERGVNYGWPIVHHRASREGLRSPLLEFTPAIAPASASFVPAGDSPLSGNLLVGCLRGEAILRVVLDGARVVRHERLVHEEYGRIRDVAAGPDGAVYFSTSNRDGRGRPADEDDRVMRLVVR